MSQRTTEEYLESIGTLEESENPVSTTSIAQSMGISLASVSEMVRRLSEKGLVEYMPYGGARLTGEGQKRYIRLTRRHRLWEVFLHKHLNIGWEDVYSDACALEHATSDLVAEKLGAVKDKHSSDAIGVLASAKCTNEENYLLQKFARAVIGTNNVDHCARL